MIDIIRPFAGFDYVSEENPTIDVNPIDRGKTWVNVTTGEVFVCTDSAFGLNKWKGQTGTYISSVNEGLINHFPLIDDMVDIAGGLSGTIYGNGVSVSNGAHFSGATGDRILLTNDGFGLTTEYTISIWASAYGVVSGGSPALHITDASGGNLLSIWFQTDDTPVTVGQHEVLLGELYHIVRTPTELYLNDVSSSEGHGDLVNPTEVNLGTDVDGGPTYNNPLTGTVRDVRIYNRNLTAEEVTELLLIGYKR